MSMQRPLLEGPGPRGACAQCGGRTAFFCKLEGFGALRRRHERRCRLAKALPAEVQAEVEELVGQFLGAVARGRAEEASESFTGSECDSVASGSTASTSSVSVLDWGTRDTAGASSRSGAGVEIVGLRGRCGDNNLAVCDVAAGDVMAGDLEPAASLEPQHHRRRRRRILAVGGQPTAVAAAALAAVWLEAPVIAGSFLVATAALWMARGPRGAVEEVEPAVLGSAGATVLRPLAAPAVSPPVLPLAAEEAEVVSKAIRLVRSFHVRDAIDLAEAHGLLSRPAQPGEAKELAWLRGVAPAVRESLSGGLSVPPPAGDGWLGPLEGHGEEGWTMSLWYRWTSTTVISTVGRLTVPGTLAQALSIFREGDLVHKWLPFVAGGDHSFADGLPAMLTCIRGKIPIIPKSLTTLVHRAFIDDFDDSVRPGGVLVVDWTPSPSDIQEGRFCGMEVPVAPSRSSEIQVRLASTLVKPASEGRCNVIMAGENDFKVNRRLVPSPVLRKFLALNMKVLAQRICACCEDGSSTGHRERVREDAQGFYALVQRRVEEAAAAR